MNLLAQLYSYGDGLKRKVNGLLSDPIGAASLGAARMAEDQQGLLGLMDQAGYTPGSKSVLQQPQDMQQARNSLADAAMQSYGGLLGATVWHGSPHKFNKFDSSKIGTGEGSQAYGHGLYLAENPTVARNYQEALAGGNVVDRMGKKISPSVGPESNALRALKDNNYDFDAAINQLAKPMTGSDKGWGIFASGAQEHRNQQLEFLKKLKAGGAKFDSPGSLYKVDLPDDQIAKMLDWDKPLSQQAPEVQAALGDLALKNQAHIGGVPIRQFIYDKTQQTGSLPSVVIGEIEKAGSLDAAIPVLQRKFSGANDAAKRKLDELLSALRQQQISMQTGVDSVRTGGDIVRGGYNPPEIAQALNGRGIPGIRYLDGGSRGAGQGSSNFVVFPGNEGLLQILERNGSPIN